MTTMAFLSFPKDYFLWDMLELGSHSVWAFVTVHFT